MSRLVLGEVGREQQPTANRGGGEEEATKVRRRGWKKDLCRVVVGAWAEISESCWSGG
jgi:hypothetical protein